MLEFLSSNIGMISTVVAGITTIAGTLFTIYKIIGRYQKNLIIKEHEIKIKEQFENTVLKLSSTNISEKLSSAILLRRFFDDKISEGIGGTPLAKEVINTIAAILRGEKTSDFQKLLADGLRYAPSLESSDLQKANLKNAVLGEKDLNFKNADFYKADLSNASFKIKDFHIDKNNYGVDLENAVFYQANLQNTNFTGANLKNANFYEAHLDGANFTAAKNIPENIKDHLDKNGKYLMPSKKNKHIFISKPRIMNELQKSIYESISKTLESKNFTLEFIEKIDDSNSSILPTLKNRIFNTSGMVIFAFKQYEISNGKFRWWHKDESRIITDDFFTTPWIYVETGMASALKKPMLVISDFKMNDNVFCDQIDDDLIFLANPNGDFNEDEFEYSLSKWRQAI